MSGLEPPRMFPCPWRRHGLPAASTESTYSCLASCVPCVSSSRPFPFCLGEHRFLSHIFLAGSKVHGVTPCILFASLFIGLHLSFAIGKQVGGATFLLYVPLFLARRVKLDTCIQLLLQVYASGASMTSRSIRYYVVARKVGLPDVKFTLLALERSFGFDQLAVISLPNRFRRLGFF